MTMSIQVVNKAENNKDYSAKVQVVDVLSTGRPGSVPVEKVSQEFILDPGQVSEEICIYDSRYVKIEEVDQKPKLHILGQG